MTYEQAQSHIFAHGNIPNGYFGKRTDVDFAFNTETGNSLVVADCGYFRSVIPPALDAAEALWLLKNHPSARNYKNVHPVTNTTQF